MHIPKNNTLTAFKHHNSQNFPWGKKHAELFVRHSSLDAASCTGVFGTSAVSSSGGDAVSDGKNLGKHGLIVAKDLKI